MPVPSGDGDEVDKLDVLLEQAFRSDQPAIRQSLPDDEFGPYQLLERLGRGGMGEVYLAEQREPIRRRVALKVLRADVDAGALIARFSIERQALAKLNHDHIARIFDAGCSRSGRPFFVMEHVAGRPITDHCDVNRLTTEQRLELFVTVCLGVHHAHENGIVHRDLKPTNVLVGCQSEQAVAKIIDFGLARAMDSDGSESSPQTRFGTVLGTPDYMSPEQASGRGLLDGRSDVYSLGVMLYELLAGVRPFEALAAKGALEAQRRIVEDDPQTPSTRITKLGKEATTIAELRGTDVHRLVRRLRGDVDWIVMRAMEKQPERRYSSALALADDIRAFLLALPIQARAASTWYRLRKWTTRHRGVLTGCVAGALLALVVTALATAPFRSKPAVLPSPELAMGNQQDDLRVALDAVAEVVNLGTESLTAVPYADDTRRAMLERALELHRRIAERQAAGMSREVAQAHVTIGESLWALGRPAEARPALLRAVAGLDEMRKSEPKAAELLVLSGRAKDCLGAIALGRDQLVDSLSMLEAAEEELRAACPAQGMSDLQRSEDQVAPEMALASCIGHKVMTLYALQRYPQALDCAEQQLQILDALQPRLRSSESCASRIRAHYYKGLALNGVQQLREAADEIQRAVDHADSPPTGIQLDRDARVMQATSRRLLAWLHFKLNDHSPTVRARELCLRALEEFRALLAESNSPDYRAGLALTLFYLAEFDSEQGDLAQALRRMEDASAEYERVLADVPDHRDSLRTLPNVIVKSGKCRMALGQTEAAIEHVLRLASERPMHRLAAARVMGAAYDQAARSAHLTGSDREALMARHVSDAIELLKQDPGAIADYGKLQVPELELLWDEPEFHALVQHPAGLANARDSILPVASQMVFDQTPEQLEQYGAQGWRITELELESEATGRLAAVMIRNEPPYRCDSWFLANATVQEVRKFASEHRCRVAQFVCTSHAERRCHAVLTRDQPLAHFWYYVPPTLSLMVRRCTQTRTRPESLSYGESVPGYSTTWVKNVHYGWRSWRLAEGLSPAQLQATVRDGWNVSDLTRLPDDTLAAILTKTPTPQQRLVFGASGAELRAESQSSGWRVLAFCAYQREGQLRYDAVLGPNRDR